MTTMLGQPTTSVRVKLVWHPFASVTVRPMVLEPEPVGVPMSFKFTLSHDMPEGMPVGAAKEYGAVPLPAANAVA
jgi:hypothetical protein